MKIEKINDNQIRCTLNKYDLASRQIKISELAYGTDKAKRLFRDMMQQAFAEFGFEAEDIPLMIEAIPISADCIILMITKVEDPDELDTRFSKFTPQAEADEESDNDNELFSEFSDLFNQVKGEIDTSSIKDSPAFIPLPQSINAKSDGAASTPKPSQTNQAVHDIPNVSKPIMTVFVFTNLDDVIKAASLMKGTYNGVNTLYKSSDDRYLLTFSQSTYSPDEFAVMCNMISEYAKMERFCYASESYYNEHYKKIINKKALQKLSTIVI